MKILKKPLWLVQRMIRQRARLEAMQQEREKLQAEIQELQATITKLYEEQARLLHENQQLQDRVKELAQMCNEADSRAATFNYRVFELSKDNERLEMILTGIRAQRDGLEVLVQRLKTEMQRLKEELAPFQSKPK